MRPLIPLIPNRRIVLASAVLSAAVLVATALPGVAATTTTGRTPHESVISVTGAPAPGPARTDRLKVIQIGDPDARRVLVLIAGRGEAANGFRNVARALTTRDPGLQVWAVDRREQNLADLSGFEHGADAAASYYLGGHYQHQSVASAPYTARWGLGTELADIRQVVLKARDAGRRQVVLGGHSLGATAVLDYAAWDFDGHPGYRDLAGMMLLDGGVRNALSGAGIDFSLTQEGADTWLQQIHDGAVFDNATSLYNNFGDGPEAAAVWYQVLAEYAADAPHQISPVWQKLPDAIRPDHALTNAGLFGWVMDQHAALPGYAVSSGHLNDAGDWVDEGPTRLQTVAQSFAGPDPSAWEWYSPNRLALDYFGSAAFADNAVARSLGLRLKHVSQINVPLYVFQSDLTHGTVGQAAQALAGSTRIPRIEVHTDETMTHLDILFAQAGQNSFVQTAGPFLRSF